MLIKDIKKIEFGRVDYILSVYLYLIIFLSILIKIKQSILFYLYYLKQTVLEIRKSIKSGPSNMFRFVGEAIKLFPV